MLPDAGNHRSTAGLIRWIPAFAGMTTIGWFGLS